MKIIQLKIIYGVSRIILNYKYNAFLIFLLFYNLLYNSII